jgi:Tfp pilus assembly protein PilW
MGTTSARSGGFTLLEALVGTALFGLILIGVLGVYASNTSVFDRGLSKAEAHQQSRVALDQLAREVRMAGHDLSGVIDSLASPTAVQAAQTDRLTFVADIDRDDTLDQVTYRLSGGAMLREVSSWNGVSFPTPSSSVLATDIVSLTFDYFDDAQPTNNLITTPVSGSLLDDVRRITISLVTTVRTGRQQQQFPLFVDVKLRN